MKKILFIVLPLILVGGGVVGAAMMGVIDIPGLTPAKKKAKAAAIYTEEKEEEPVVQKKPEPEPEAIPAVVETPLDLEKGRRAVAKLWNEMEPATILAIVADWKDDELAEQLRYLAPDKTSELLGVMKADRASRLSKLIQLIVAKEKEV